MLQEDPLHSAVQPLNYYLAAILMQNGWPPKVVGGVVGLVQVGEVTLLIGGVALICAALRRITAGTDGRICESRWTIDGVSLIAASIAAGLFYWSVRFPGADISALFGRWDHLVFCAFSGFALSRLSLEWRMWAITLLSGYFMVHYTGVIPLALVLGGGLLGFAALRLPVGEKPWSIALLQGIILAGVYAVSLRMRSHNPLGAFRAEIAFAFVALRHVSFVVETYRARRARLGAYMCYMLFYPSFIGASELYSEFSERNFVRDTRYDYRAAVGKIVQGQLQMLASLQIDTSFEQVLRIQNPLSLWLNVLILFVRSSLFVMGLWATIEGVALLYGFRLRPNFAGILSCENPAQLWYAWRGTMTNWLVHYVYIPLGGNRRRHLRNICAAFAVSTLWHWMGLPFFSATRDVRNFVPIGMWGAVNALAVSAYVYFRRSGRQVLPAWTPSPVRRASKIFLTACVGTFTVTLLSFRPETMEFFPAFLRTLVGMSW